MEEILKPSGEQENQIEKLRIVSQDLLRAIEKSKYFKIAYKFEVSKLKKEQEETLQHALCCDQYGEEISKLMSMSKYGTIAEIQEKKDVLAGFIRLLEHILNNQPINEDAIQEQEKDIHSEKKLFTIKKKLGLQGKKVNKDNYLQVVEELDMVYILDKSDFAIERLFLDITKLVSDVDQNTTLSKWAVDRLTAVEKKINDHINQYQDLICQINMELGPVKTLAQWNELVTKKNADKLVNNFLFEDVNVQREKDLLKELQGALQKEIFQIAKEHPRYQDPIALALGRFAEQLTMRTVHIAERLSISSQKKTQAEIPHMILPQQVDEQIMLIKKQIDMGNFSQFRLAKQRGEMLLRSGYLNDEKTAQIHAYLETIEITLAGIVSSVPKDSPSKGTQEEETKEKKLDLTQVTINKTTGKHPVDDLFG